MCHHLRDQWAREDGRSKSPRLITISSTHLRVAQVCVFPSLGLSLKLYTYSPLLTPINSYDSMIMVFFIRRNSKAGGDWWENQASSNTMYIPCSSSHSHGVYGCEVQSGRDEASIPINAPTSFFLMRKFPVEVSFHMIRIKPQRGLHAIEPSMGLENPGRRQPVNYYCSLQVDDVQSNTFALNTGSLHHDYLARTCNYKVS